MIHEVKGCRDCAFVSEFDYCYCPALPDFHNTYVGTYMNNSDGDKFPIWCPLQTEEIVIKLVQ